MPPHPITAALVALCLTGLLNAPARADEQAPEALLAQAIRLEHAEGVPRDLAAAHALYCAAARQDNAEALVRLGWIYANGRGVPRDDNQAQALFQRAQALGHAHGARLATMIRGSAPRLPECVVPPPVADTGPTPTVDDPAQFREASPSAQALAGTVTRLAREYRLDPRLVTAVIRAESGFDPLARSPRNAQGLMQLIPETAERFGVGNPWNPTENLHGGMRYLRWLLSYFRGDVVLALAAYNAGEGAVDRHGGVPPYAETLAYVQRIRAIYPFDRHAYDPRIAAPRVSTVAGVRLASIAQ